MPRSSPANAPTKSSKWKSNAKSPPETLPLAKSPTTSSNNPDTIQPYAHLQPNRSLISISACEQLEKSLQITRLNSKAEPKNSTNPQKERYRSLPPTIKLRVLEEHPNLIWPNIIAHSSM
jgi:hypothetical protein